MYHVRIWHPSDLPWLEWGVSAGAWESLAPEDLGSVVPDQVGAQAVGQLRQVLGDPGGIGLVAVDRLCRPVGFLLAGAAPDASTEELHGHLIAIWVAPEHRRRGLGTYLQGIAEGLFARMGIRKAKLWTGIHNRKVLSMAARRGYTAEGIIGMKTL